MTDGNTRIASTVRLLTKMHLTGYYHEFMTVSGHNPRRLAMQDSRKPMAVGLGACPNTVIGTHQLLALTL
jgi:hypothetical protein